MTSDEKDPYEISEEEEGRIDAALEALEQATGMELPDGWVHLVIAVPNDFAEIFQDTLSRYKKLRATDKVFPALEAMVLEARNSLPVSEDEVQ